MKTLLIIVGGYLAIGVVFSVVAKSTEHKPTGVSKNVSRSASGVASEWLFRIVYWPINLFALVFK